MEQAEAPELPALTDAQWCKLLSCAAFAKGIDGVRGKDSFPLFTSGEADITTAADPSGDTDDDDDDDDHRAGGAAPRGKGCAEGAVVRPPILIN